jgi:drug/metabolite transporter (DMT)-like permease
VAAVGVCYCLGLVLLYASYARGQVSIIAPIASTEGAIAATLAIALGEPATPMLILALAVTATGIVLTTLEPGTRLADFRFGSRTVLLLAVGAALSFALGLYAAGRVSDAVPLAWIATSGRVVAVLVVAVPLALLRRLRYERGILWLVVVAGIMEVLGYLTFAWGARDQVAVAAVLSSQFAVLVALASTVLGERLGRRQWLGIGLAAGGVAAVALVRA